jgi:hypothetical protein
VLSKLPGWAIDNDTSVREEVAPWRGLAPAELWRLARMCSRDVVWALRLCDKPERVLEQRDPVPESTLEALARLRRRSGWNR